MRDKILADELRRLWKKWAIDNEDDDNVFASIKSEVHSILLAERDEEEEKRELVVDMI